MSKYLSESGLSYFWSKILARLSSITSALNGKVDQSQGAAHAGEFLVVGQDGNVTTQSLQVWTGGDY